jgi:alpha-tubulin suppressor-like RCC1 family protein
MRTTPLAPLLLLLAGCGGGDATPRASPTGSPAPTTIPTTSPPVAQSVGFAYVSAGRDHTCGNSPFSEKCWGANGSGQLGDGSTTGRPLPAGWITGLDRIGSEGSWPAKAGGSHTCALGWLDQAPPNIPTQLYCWGDNQFGQLGNGSFTGSARPRAVAPSSTGDLVDAGWYTAGENHSCGISKATGVVHCWGANGAGQLGNGTSNDSAVPVAVAGNLRALSPPATLGTRLLLSTTPLSAGAAHTCAVNTDGAAYCWGANGSGQLGNASSASSLVPVAVSGALSVASISVGERHSCALTTSGAAYCWGANGEGQLGNGSSVNSAVPTAVAGGLTFVSLSAGSNHVCGVALSAAATTYTAYCWGSNVYGQLGDGTTTSRNAPVRVAGGLDLLLVSAGARHSCGSTVAGTAHCWGSNDMGQLGNGSSAPMSVVPLLVAAQP